MAEIAAEQASAAGIPATCNRYAFRVGGKKFTFELAPRVSNVWENAFATESFNYEDLAYYERQKEYTEFVFVGPKRTLTVTAAFPPDSTAVLRSVVLPKYESMKRVAPGSMTFFGKFRPIIILHGSWSDTTTDDLIEIERVRRSREQAGGVGARQPVAPGVTVRAVSGASPAETVVQVPIETPRVSRFRIKRLGEAVEYEGKTYEFEARKAWENLSRLLEGRGGYVLCDRGLKKFFNCKDAKAFYDIAIEPKGEGRNGDGTYRLKI